MRGLLLGAAVAGAVALAIFITPGGVRADEPVPPDGDALAELVFAGAPLVSDATSDPSAGSSSSVGPPPNGPAAAPAAVSVPPPNVDPQVNPALPDIPVPNPVDILGLDPKDWAGDILNAILTMIGKALIEAFRGFTDWALGVSDSSLNFVTRTPAAGTYESPTVLSLWDFSRALVNVSLAAIVMWGGFNIMVKEHTRSPYHEAMELLPRVILAALAANLTLEFAKFLIDLNNALAGVGRRRRIARLRPGDARAGGDRPHLHGARLRDRRDPPRLPDADAARPHRHADRALAGRGAPLGAAADAGLVPLVGRPLPDHGVPAGDPGDGPQPRHGADGRAHAGQPVQRPADADARHRRLLADAEGAVAPAQPPQSGGPVQRDHARGSEPRGWRDRRRGCRRR